MKSLAIPALAATLLLLLPCTAAAQENPEAVYGKYHQAVRAGNMEEVKKYVTAEGRRQVKPIPADQRDGMLALIRAVLPQSYTVTGKELSPDGKSLTLRATGMGTNLMSEKPESMSGVIRMLKEGNDWKVEKPEWHSTNQRGLTPETMAKPTGTLRFVPQSTPKKQPVAAAPKVAATPKATAPVLGAAKEPCVYKPVMSDEDIKRCR